MGDGRESYACVFISELLSFHFAFKQSKKSTFRAQRSRKFMEIIMECTDSDILEEGRRVFQVERAAVLAIEQSLGQSFVNAVRLILKTKGNVIFSGVGKSGHVARKLAATFASTGTTSYFVHADEAAHGDMGMIRPDDIFIGLSGNRI